MASNENNKNFSKISSGLAASGLVSQAIGSIGTGISDYISSSAFSRYQRAIAESNAKIAAYKIKDAVDRGDMASSEYLKKAGQVRSSQKVSLAAQGISVENGSAYDTLSDTDFYANLGAIQIRNNAAREAFGYKIESINNTAQASLSSIATDRQGAQSLLTGGLNSLGYGLGSIDKFISIFSKGSGNKNGTAREAY